MATYRKRGNSWRVEICVNGIRASSSHDTKAQAKHWAIHKEVEMKAYYSDIPRHTLREAPVKYRDTVFIYKKGAKWEMSRINKFIVDSHHNKPPILKHNIEPPCSHIMGRHI
ncbi:MAG: hypothetical protein Q7S87_18245 [Agitococcus sp.]|nr:hypothetical protein [Agitococcus sp.]